MTLSRQELLTLARHGALARIQALEAEIASIRRAFPGLGGGVRKGRPAAPERAVPTRRRRRRRRLSADVRARLSKLAKQRWAKAKKAGKKRL